MQIKEYKRKKDAAYALIIGGGVSIIITYFLFKDFSFENSIDADFLSHARWIIYAGGLGMLAIGARYLNDSTPFLVLSPQGFQSNQGKIASYGVINWKDIIELRLRIQKNKNNKTYYAMLVLSDNFYYSRNIKKPSGWLHKLNSLTIGEGISINLSQLEGKGDGIYEEVEGYWNRYR